MAPRFSATLIPAIITPFDANLALDLPTLKQITTYLANNGCDGILVNGTTGEAPTLSLAEKKETFLAVKEALADSNTQLIVGIGSNNTVASVEEATFFADLGAQALLVVVPYYNKPTQDGLFQHFKAIAEAVPHIEIVIYNIPSRSVVLMSPQTMARLHTVCPNIIGVKQSHSDMDAVSEITALLGQHNWLTWCGDDTLTLPMMACGAHGTFSVLAHLLAPTLRTMIDAFKANDNATALACNLQLLGPGKEIFFMPNPTVTKSVLKRCGVLPNTTELMRLPLVVPSQQSDLDRIEALTKHIKSIQAPLLAV
jgi:4-hydroxy-tetrahydrodipicolinate synthase